MRESAYVIRSSVGLLAALALIAVVAAPASAAEIGNLVFEDTDGDGVQDAGEGGVSSVTVRLYDPGADGVAGGGDDTLLSETQTNSSGVYAFTGLVADDYYLVFTAPSGKVFTLQDQGGNDALDSDVDRDGRTGVITLAGGATDDSVDCGLVSPATVGDTVFLDEDGDGIQDSTENGQSGVTVRLFDPGVDGVAGGGDDTQIGVTTTSSSGRYVFSAVHGDYYIKVDLPTDFVFSPQNQGADDAADSDVDATGITAVFTLTVEDEEETIDAGLYEHCEVSGTVWLDADGDGLLEDTEGDAPANVKVQLFDDTDTQVGVDVDTTNTYSFANLDPGKYYVKFTPPAGYSLVPANQGADDTVDSDPNQTTLRTDLFLLTSGDTVDTLDAGVAKFSTIGNFAFIDDDEDGVQDGGESGAAGALVLLYTAGENGTAGDSDDQLVTSATADNAGAYQLSAVAGDYYIEAVAPAGYTLTAADQGGDDTVDSDVSPSTRRSAVFTLAEDATDNTRDVGFIVDSDNDGTADSSDDCPNDPGKTAPGECGCGTSDVDSDADGVLDCFDNCPSTYNPDQADLDGDNVGDACADLDDGDADDAQDGTGGDSAADGGDDEDIGDLPREGGTIPRPDETVGDGALPACGTCGPLGMFSYAFSVLGCTTLLLARRRWRS